MGVAEIDDTLKAAATAKTIEEEKRICVRKLHTDLCVSVQSQARPRRLIFSKSRSL
jgi:hypothetical protein